MSLEPTAFEPPEIDLEVQQPKPTLWRVLVRPLEAKERTDAGIALTRKTQEDQRYVTVVGQIVDLGPTAFTGPKFEGSECQIGDWVLYPTYGGQTIELADGRAFVIMNDDAILCRIDDPELYRKKLV